MHIHICLNFLWLQLLLFVTRLVLHECALAADFRGRFELKRGSILLFRGLRASGVSAVVPLPHRPRRRTPRQTRRAHRVQVVLLGGHPPKGKLALVCVVIGCHRQRESHVLDEKLLRRDLAAVDADAGAARFLQKPAALDENALVLESLSIDLDVVYLTFPHKPLPGDPGRPGVHARGKLKESRGR